MSTETSTATNSDTGGWLEAVWDRVSTAVGGFMEGTMKLFTRLFGSSNERYIKALGYIRADKPGAAHTVVPGSLLDQVNRLEEKMKALSDDELKGLTPQYRQRLAQGATLDSLLPEAFAACREAARR